MDSSSALEFCYTKAAGLLSTSFLNQRMSLLFNSKSLVELWAVLFSDSVPAVPEALLADEIEKKAFNNLLQQYLSILNQFDNPSDLLLSQIQLFEIENIKSMMDGICNGEPLPPKIIDLKKYSTLNISAYPDLEKITRNTIFNWLPKNPELKDLQLLEFKMDLFFLKSIWDKIEKSKGEDKGLWEKLFLEDYIIKNIIWAMRLSVYYQKSKEEIMAELFYVTERADKLDPIAGSAIAVLDKSPVNFEDWQNWKYKEYLNPYEGTDWKFDPAWFERRYMASTSKRYIRFFHQHPLTEPALVAWFKAKQYELRCIRSAVEGTRLNINPTDAMKALGAIIE